MKVKVSVITPLYKGKQYIPKLMQMMINNAGKVSMEYILVNDSPKEYLLNEQNLINEYGLSYRLQFKAVNNPVNMGIQKSRAAGLAAAEGEYICFLDQDDYLEDDALFRMLSYMEKEDCDVLTANGYRRYPAKDGQCLRLVPLYKRKAALKAVCNEKMYLYGTDMIFSPGQCLIKKASIPDEWSGYTLEINGCDDFLMWLMMFQKGCRFRTVWDKLYYHNETRQNYSASYEAMEKSFENMCDILEKISWYDNDKVQILRRRYKLKSLLKSGVSPVKKVSHIFKNLDIIIYTISYKLEGYH